VNTSIPCFPPCASSPSPLHPPFLRLSLSASSFFFLFSFFLSPLWERDPLTSPLRELSLSTQSDRHLESCHGFLKSDLYPELAFLLDLFSKRFSSRTPSFSTFLIRRKIKSFADKESSNRILIQSIMVILLGDINTHLQ